MADWGLAPEGATHWGKSNAPDGRMAFFKFVGDELHWFRDGAWACYNGASYAEHSRAFIATLTARPLEWPSEERINRIGRDRTEDDMGHYDAVNTQDWSKAPEWADRWAIATIYGAPIWYNATNWQYVAGGDECRIADYGYVDINPMTVCIRPGTNRKEDATVVDDGIAQKIAATPRNKHDRVIHGKYGTGKCTVDVYRVLNAFGPLSPEIDHAVKKLLSPGQRGAKSERQDLLEAIQSIEARLQYLEVIDGDKP